MNLPQSIVDREVGEMAASREYGRRNAEEVGRALERGIGVRER
jgi:hypothetical protein